jgi:hypothetical protein
MSERDDRLPADCRSAAAGPRVDPPASAGAEPAAAKALPALREQQTLQRLRARTHRSG